MTTPKKRSTSGELMDLIKQLTAIRKEHVRALEEIETTFRMFGLDYLLTNSGTKRNGKKGPGKLLKAVAAGKKAGSKNKSAASSIIKAVKGAKKGAVSKAPIARKRGTFEMTGDELILRFVRDKGGATTEQIRKHWEASGRGGKSDNNITNLVKSGRLLRTKAPTGIGSIYTASEASAPVEATDTTTTA